jgi:hypothetical protein
MPCPKRRSLFGLGTVLGAKYFITGGLSANISKQ